MSVEYRTGLWAIDRNGRKRRLRLGELPKPGEKLIGQSEGYIESASPRRKRTRSAVAAEREAEEEVSRQVGAKPTGYVPETEQEKDCMRAVNLSLAAQERAALAEAARAIRGRVHAQYLRAIDRKYAAPADANAGLEALRLGALVERVDAAVRRAEALAREAAREADAALALVERERMVAGRRR